MNFNIYKNNKYGNKKIYGNGEKFDSKLEYERYKQLKLLERTGEIRNLRLQTKFVLQPAYTKNGKKIRAIEYFADFTYYDTRKEKMIVEDTKGIKTEVYKIKKKIFEYKYPDLEIVEIRKEDV